MWKSAESMRNEFLAGNSTDAYKYLGSHLIDDAVVFRVWAPNALSVFVVGDFNGWNDSSNAMYKIDNSGIWETTIANVHPGDCYKYSVETPWHTRVLKSDPYAFYSEVRPNNASKVHDFGKFKWNDAEWLETKSKEDRRSIPFNIYEINAGSWRRHSDGSYYGYRALADELVPYIAELGYTHVEFMPLTEFPFDGSWGYQVTGYFSATSRYGTPEDLMYLIDKCHQHNIGVILDWVPAHFPKDGHGLARFDGTGCYEYEDWRLGEHKEWGTYIFNYSRYEVTSFLISSALFWLNEYHFDGIRVDAVASMLYLDYNRKEGEWIPNAYGGRENLVAVEFLRKLNRAVHENCPHALMIAEESTAWPNVTGDSSNSLALGFDYKWNMGWMNDMLSYISEDPLWRNYHHDKLTFSMMYAFSENFILPISHDEVVYGKGSLVRKMPGDDFWKFAGVRNFVSYMMAHPGKKLMFMGAELGQWNEWNAETQLDWYLLENESNYKLHEFFKAVNHFYRNTPAMYENDYNWEGFQWLALSDSGNSIIAFRRVAKNGDDLICVCNFQPVTRGNYRIGVPKSGVYREVFNSESTAFGGTGIGNPGDIRTISEGVNSFDYAIDITIPPLGVTYYQLVEETTEE